MADPVTVSCTSACTVTLDVQVKVPPFSLTEDEGAAIAVAILAVWVVAWAFRVLVRMLKETDGNSTPEET